MRRRQMKILQYSAVLKKLGVLTEEEYNNIKHANKLKDRVHRH